MSKTNPSKPQLFFFHHRHHPFASFDNLSWHPDYDLTQISDKNEAGKTIVFIKALKFLVQNMMGSKKTKKKKRYNIHDAYGSQYPVFFFNSLTFASIYPSRNSLFVFHIWLGIFFSGLFVQKRKDLIQFYVYHHSVASHWQKC